ncbi:MFS transporter [Planobispora rosea]|uniref:MFS transporter n=1 Tax=Planobispora rosea TaxID=35762 RepID=A0A8J3WEJ0_PLARO|nr:MFS transporter [Planobispora rosea]GGS83953.1 MFS transporter [Planobispora rosea]GIH86283.1 MFS transporter [Planobispora rosea]
MTPPATQTGTAAPSIAGGSPRAGGAASAKADTASPSGTGGSRERSGQGLLHVYTSLTLSTVAARMLGITYPLLALFLTGSPVEVGWVGFALTLPTLLFYIPAGVLVDRVAPRPLMLVTEAGRALAAFSVALAVIFEVAGMPYILLTAFVEGTLWVVYSLAEMALIRSLAPQNDLTEMLAMSETGSHIAVMTARPVGGLLFGMIPGIPFLPFLANSLMFAVSFRSMAALTGKEGDRAWRLPGRSEVADTARAMFGSSSRGEIVDGIRELRRHPFLCMAMALTATTNLMVNALIVVFISGSSAFEPVTVGLVLAAGGIGGVLGSSLAPGLRRSPRLARVRSGKLMLFAQMWISVLALSVAAFGPHLAFVGVATLLTGCAGALSNVTIRAYEINEVGEGKLARVVSVHRLAVHGAVCLAAPLGGFLASVNGVTAAPMSLFSTMAVLALLFSLGWLLRYTWKKLTRHPEDA